MSAFKSPALQDAGSIRAATPKRVAPTGILHFTIGVSDLERSRRFYEEVVGCTFWRKNDTTVFMRCGDDHITLSRSGYHAAPNRGRDTLIHHAFIIAPDAFDAAIADRLLEIDEVLEGAHCTSPVTCQVLAPSEISDTAPRTARSRPAPTWTPSASCGRSSATTWPARRTSRNGSGCWFARRRSCHPT